MFHVAVLNPHILNLKIIQTFIVQTVGVGDAIVDRVDDQVVIFAAIKSSAKSFRVYDDDLMEL